MRLEVARQMEQTNKEMEEQLFLQLQVLCVKMAQQCFILSTYYTRNSHNTQGALEERSKMHEHVLCTTGKNYFFTLCLALCLSLFFPTFMISL